MRRQLGREVMRTLQAASWWLIFGQPPPSKTLKSLKPPFKTIASNLTDAKISQQEPPPLSKAERNLNSAGSEISISDAKTENSNSDYQSVELMSSLKQRK